MRPTAAEITPVSNAMPCALPTTCSRTARLLAGLAIGAFGMLGVCGSVHAADPQWAAADVEFFESRIRPVLIERCYRCHSQDAVEKNQLKGNLLVDTRDGLLKGGDSGPAISPGDPAGSLLLEAVRYESYEMPPDGRLSDQVINDFATWIERGAADPRGGTSALSASTIDWEAGRKHWAYRPLAVPPKRPHIPLPSTPAAGSSRGAAPRAAAPASPIDAFILDKLDDVGIEPLPQADRITLARRLTFDLTGLPPTPRQIDDFVADTSPDAYERFVDRLLASPQFGERWGRHWLDVVRFAESVTLRGLVQHEAWRYRDYVIESFNRDVPYNEFLRQQIAGDLLTASTIEEDRRKHIATTFLTLANANLEDQDKEKLRMDVVDEQLNVIGSALLGQTIGCARCHDHKFDPIPTTDYYALAGILRNTRTMEHANVSRWLERPLPVPPELEQQVQAHERQVKELQQEIAALKRQSGTAAPSRKAVAVASLPGIVLDDEQATFVGQWQSSNSVGAFVGSGYQYDGNSGQGMKRATFQVLLPGEGDYDVRLSYTAHANRSSRVRVNVVDATGEHPVTINQRQRPSIDGLFVSLGRYYFTASEPARVVISNRNANGHVVIDAVQFLPAESDVAADARQPTTSNDESPAADQTKAAARKARQRVKDLEAELKQVQKDGPQRPTYMAVEEEAEIADMHVNVRGNVHNLGPQVPRGFLQVVSIGPAGDTELPEDESGRRQLGDWLADPKNPLPARVFANRVWHWLFGAGLVRTPDNLGTTGEAPSHPELLDYLAGRLIERNWSVKQLVREVVLSQAYRRDSTGPESEISGQKSEISSHASDLRSPASDLRADPSTPVAVDPENRLLWRMNRKRLEAECLLDAVLCVSGNIDRRMGGKTIPDGLLADYDFKHDSRQRAIYWPVLRNAIPELVLAFDGANPSLVTGRRNVSSVAPQALYLMNNPWIIEQSRIAARQLLEGDALSESTRTQETFRLVLGRPPTDDEEQTVRDFLAENPSASEEARLARWSQLVQSLLCTVDFRYLQ